ncbi:MAG: PKD domain-containing protein [Carbonactinosporaceae bacterium]
MNSIDSVGSPGITLKIDYIFFSDFGWDLVDGGRIAGSKLYNDGELSDHWMLKGIVKPSDDQVPTSPAGELDPLDVPPSVDAGPDAHGVEGSAVSLEGSATDDRGVPAVRWSIRSQTGVDPGTTCRFGDPRTAATSFACTDDGTFTVTLTADDGVNPPVNDSATVRLRNAAPTLHLTGPKPWSVYRVGEPAAVSASFTDPGTNDTHVCRFGWDDGRAAETHRASGSSCSRTHTFADPGMYEASVGVADDDGGRDRASVMVVLYDPAAGLAASAGSISSPRGALAGSPDSGVARFTALAKYLTMESTAPFGRVSLTVPGTDMRLRSTDLEWLVITPNGKVAIKGTGRVDGKDGYGFLAYAQSGRYRSVVWPLSKGMIPPGSPLYDSVRGASYDVDKARPQPVTAGLSAIDTGWVPGVPSLDGDVRDALRKYGQRTPKTLEVQGTLPAARLGSAVRTQARAGAAAEGASREAAAPRDDRSGSGTPHKADEDTTFTAPLPGIVGRLGGVHP